MTSTRYRKHNIGRALLMAKFTLMRIWHKVVYIVPIVILLAVVALNTELDFGVCLNDQGDGMVINANPQYDYISYRYTEAQTGDRVFTIFFLNPANLEPDDYIYRNDWIIGG